MAGSFCHGTLNERRGFKCRGDLINKHRQKYRKLRTQKINRQEHQRQVTRTTNQHKTTNTRRLNRGTTKEGNETDRWDKSTNNQITRWEGLDNRQESTWHKTTNTHVQHKTGQACDITPSLRSGYQTLHKTRTTDQGGTGGTDQGGTGETKCL